MNPGVRSDAGALAVADGAASMDGIAERALARAWLALALAALVAGAVFAAAVAGARTPGVGAALGLTGGFARALVMHVTLATTMWLLALLSALWSTLPERDSVPGWVGFGAAALGAVFVSVAWYRGANAILSNYVPVLDGPDFVAGLGLFALGAATAGARALVGRSKTTGLRAGALRLAVVPLFVSLGVLGMSWAALGGADAAAVGGLSLPTLAEPLFWASGHGMQFVYTLLAIACWVSLLGDRLENRAVVRVGLALAVLPVLVAPVIVWLHPVDSATLRSGFTTLMRWSGWPGALLVIAAAVGGLLRAPRSRLDGAAAVALGSMGLFVLGLVIGFTIRGETTSVPAHYHATVGAATLGGIGVALRALAVLADAQRRVRWPIAAAHGCGFALLVTGLAIAGANRVPRKAAMPHVPEGSLAAQFGMVVMGIGATLAVLAVLWLGVHALATAIARRRLEAPRRVVGRDVRPRTIAITVAAIAVLGATLAAYTRGSASPQSGEVRGAPNSAADEASIRFQQGVWMLHSKQYEHAVTAFHKVLELDPSMPEAHVNLGYAFIGLGQHAMARDFFVAAIDLRSEQVNAYFGLAIALEGLSDYRGALGAMRTYVHLARGDDPWLPRARAALWEWEQRSAQTRR